MRRVAFRSTDLPVKVCAYCRTSVLRDDAGVRAMGKAATVPDDVSPLQLGARGRDGDLGFELIGRIRWRWTDGGWNEWLALFDDGSHGWLGEAMGRIMLLRAVPLDTVAPSARERLANGALLAVGDRIAIAALEYDVADARTVTAMASEGELPFPAPAGLTMASVDLQTGDGRCASLQREGTKTEAFVGRYAKLAELRMTNLRAFDGWPMPDWAA